MNARVRAMFLVFGALLGCGGKGESFVSVSPSEAVKLLEDPNTFLLDVRTREEYAAEHLSKATLIPLQELEQRLAELPQNKDQALLLYCRSGNRTISAASILANHGYKNIFNLKGGIKEWVQHAFPVETAPAQ
jgi:rhodanese-related sulfurtransferase